MPQMAPLNWTSLYITFTMLFLMTNFLNYFMYMKYPIQTKTQIMKKSINWKW